jgi:peroxiredoxin family protein
VGHTLSFNASADGEEIEVHMSRKGLAILLKNLSQLQQAAESDSEAHVHLMSEEWGGWELDARQSDRQSRSANKVSLYLWQDEGDNGSQ